MEGIIKLNFYLKLRELNKRKITLGKETEKIMKILAIGDVHFKTNNIPEVDTFLIKIEELLKREKVDLIVVLGDVLDTHEKLHTIPFNKACKFFDVLRRYAKVYILVGNHDMCMGGDVLIPTENALKNVYDITIHDKVISEKGRPLGIDKLFSGNMELFRVNYSLFDKTHTFSSNHMLTLAKHRRMAIDIYTRKRVVEYVTRNEDKQLEFYRRFIEDIPIDERREIFYDFFDINQQLIDIPISEYIYLPQYVKDKLYGVKIVGKFRYLSPISVTSIGFGPYYGFSIKDDEKRFLLEGDILTHNCNNQQFLSENHWMNPFKNWENVVIVDKVIHENFLDGDLMKDNSNIIPLTFCPYVYPGRFKEALDTVKEWEKSCCIFAHQEFMGCKMGAFNSEIGDTYNENFPMVISGHIHSRQWVQKNIFYTGSAMQHAFGESEKNIVAIVDITYDTGNIKEKNNGEKNWKININEIDLELPRKKTIYMDISILMGLKKVEDIPDKGVLDTVNKIRLSLSGTLEEFKAFKKKNLYKLLTEKGIKIKYNRNKVEIKEIKIIPEDIEKETQFELLLRDMVHSECNSYLTVLYERILNNVEISVENIIYI